MKFYGGRLVAGFFLLAGLGLAISSAGAEVKNTKKRVKNHASSCYAQLVSMLHNSSFPTSAKNLRYLTLHVETDEGDGITLRVRRVGGKKNHDKRQAVDIDSDTVGWLLYQPSSHNMVSLSSFLNPERPDVTTFLEKGDSLKFDRRYAYLFDACRKKRDVELETRCATRHKDAVKIKIQSRDEGAPVKAKISDATLYAAPDKSCVMTEKARIASGAQVTVQSMSDEFYYIRYDEGKKGFITGWVLKDTLPTLNIALPEKETLEIAQKPQKKTQKKQKQSKKIDRKPVRNEKTDKVRLPKYKPHTVAEPAVFDVEEAPPPSNLVKAVDNKKPDRIRLPKAKPVYVKAKKP